MDLDRLVAASRPSTRDAERSPSSRRRSCRVHEQSQPVPAHGRIVVHDEDGVKEGVDRAHRAAPPRPGRRRSRRGAASAQRAPDGRDGVGEGAPRVGSSKRRGVDAAGRPRRRPRRQPVAAGEGGVGAREVVGRRAAACSARARRACTSGSAGAAAPRAARSEVDGDALGLPAAASTRSSTKGTRAPGRLGRRRSVRWAPWPDEQRVDPAARARPATSSPAAIARDGDDARRGAAQAVGVAGARSAARRWRSAVDQRVELVGERQQPRPARGLRQPPPAASGRNCSPMACGDGSSRPRRAGVLRADVRPPARRTPATSVDAWSAFASRAARARAASARRPPRCQHQRRRARGCVGRSASDPARAW